MSRRPSDQIARDPNAEGRQVIWEAIRAKTGPFTIPDIVQATYISRHTVRSYLNCLVAGGLMRRFEDEKHIFWELLRDEGYYYPRLNQRGERVTQGMGVEQMWRTMRIMHQFSPRELALQASTDDVQIAPPTAKKYCTHLLQAGYLRCVQKATHERQAIYRLIRNSGPQAPQIQRALRIWDPNTETTWDLGGRHG